MMGLHLVVLSDSDVASELVERCSAKYCDRVCRRSDSFTILALTGTHLQPQLPMTNELYEWSNSESVTGLTNDHFRMGCSRFFSMMPYGNTWRIHRKLFHRFFNVSTADQFDDKIYKAVDVFLHRLLKSPDRFLKHAHL
jgi:hypothetical protein